MKHHYSNFKLPHAWLYKHKELEHGEGSHMWFRRNTIYSYGEHFPIATVIEKSGEHYIPMRRQSALLAKIRVPKGKRGVVFYTRSRASNTTNKHQSYVLGAIPQEEYALIRWSAYKYSDDKTVVDVIKHDYKEALENSWAKFRKANKLSTKEWYSNDVMDLCASYQDTFKVLGFSDKKTINRYHDLVAQWVDEKAEWIKAKEAREQKAIEKRAKKLEPYVKSIKSPMLGFLQSIKNKDAANTQSFARAITDRHENIKANCGYNECQDIYNSICHWFNYLDETNAYSEAIKNYLTPMKEALLQSWREGGPRAFGRGEMIKMGMLTEEIITAFDYLPNISMSLDDYAYLRVWRGVVMDTEEDRRPINHIETSMGVTVTEQEARVAYKAWKAGKLRPGMKLAHYTILSLNGDGTFKIGCHVIPHEEVERLAKELNW